MKTYLQPSILHILAITATLMQPKSATAQISVTANTLNYTQDFNMLDTTTANSANLPTGWAIYEYGSNSNTVNNQYKGNTGTSTTGDIYSYGSPGTTERALGSIATSSNKEFYGVSFINNTGVTISSVALTYRGEQWRKGTTAMDRLLFRYSTSATNMEDTLSSLWIIDTLLSLSSLYAGNLTSTALNGNDSGNSIIKTGVFNVDVPIGDTLWITWMDIDATGSDDGLSIDDINLSFTTSSPPPVTNILIVDKMPEGNDIPLSTNELTIKFDHAVTSGIGEVRLYKNGVLIPATFPVPAVTITTSDSTAIISGVSLENNTQYYVQLTEGSFTHTDGSLPNLAISDSSTWTFITVDTIVITPPGPVVSLNETFNGCTDTAIGQFVQYSTEGNRIWHCIDSGHTDMSAAQMIGGIAADVSQNNMDWLISSNAFDFAAMSEPELRFWQKRRYNGNVTREIKISTNYIPGTDPVTASWITVPVQDIMDAPAENTWTNVTGIDLKPYKSIPFFLAFTYSCGTDGAYELTYDDIQVEDLSLGIAEYNPNNLSVRILGYATTSAITYSITLNVPTTLHLDIFDLAGRRLYQEMVAVKAGNNTYCLNGINLQPGLYILHVNNGVNSGMVKVMVQ